MSYERSAILEIHGAGRAFYNRPPAIGAAGGSPTLTCACGWIPEATFETWSEAGAALDKHIKDSLRRQGELIDSLFEDEREKARENRAELLRQRAAKR